MSLRYLRKAAEQAHGKAAIALGIDFKNEGRFQEALEILQMGFVGGNECC
jgi:hypothetical protein